MERRTSPRPALRRATLLLAIAATLAGCSPAEKVPRSDVLLLTIDTLRGDRWGCLGDPRARTPVIDRLVRGGTLAFEGRAPAPITLPSHVSIMTGLPPSVHGVRDNGIFRLGSEGTTLAERLAEEGYATAAFISAYPIGRGFGLDRGFDHYDSALGGGSEELGLMRQRSAEQTLRRVSRWFARDRAPSSESPQPLFLWVHFFDPHADYVAPEPWRSLFPDAPYRGEVAYVDFQTGRLLETLENARPGRARRIVVTADHGEGLGEHGETSHGTLLHTSTVRVPIVVRDETFAPALLPYAVSVERVPATILAMDDLDWELNRDAAPPLTDPATAIHAETLYPFFNFGWRALRSREEDGWRLVSGEFDRLYRLDDDPGERRDLAAQHPERLERMKRDLEREWEVRERAAFRVVDREISEEDLEALHALGYAGGSSPGASAGVDPFETGPDPSTKQSIVDRINLGSAYRKIRDFERAAEVFGSIVDEEPANRLALLHLGTSLRELGRLEEARDAFRSALTEDTNPLLLYLELALVERTLGNRDAERDLLAEGLTNYPKSAEARVRMARLLVDEGEPAKALVILQEALEVRPRFVETHASLAIVYQLLERPEPAREHWNRVLELEPQGPIANRARRALELLERPGS